ncbi:MAG: hypothetical protein OEY23_25935 [Acidimicrobiia bacterium]|nr:hypothetical protein [Acidimicrobiia bacterium]
MLPPLDPLTGYLPPDEHEATWEEVVERFGSTAWRRRLLDGLAESLTCWRQRDVRGCG